MDFIPGSEIKKYDWDEDFLMSLLPKNFKFYRKPRLHQLLSLVFALQFDDGTGQFLEMGTGKTKITIDLLRALGIKDDILVVTVNAAVENWRREFILDSGSEYSVKVLQGSSKEKNEGLHTQNDVFIMNYEGLFREPEELKGLKDDFRIKMKRRMTASHYILPNLNIPWNAVVFDESRMLMNSSSIRGKVCLKLAQQSKYRVILTGLPIAKNLTEIWSQQYCIDLGRQFGDFRQFKYQYMRKIWSGGFPKLVPKSGAETLVHEKMYIQGIRFIQDECLDLPEKSYQTRFVEMGGDQLRHYKEFAEKKSSTVVTSKNKVELIGIMIRFQQICGGWLKVLGDDTKEFKSNAKLKELEYLLDEELQYESVVVIASFVAEQKGIYEFLKKKGKKVGKIVAGMTGEEISQTIDKFDSGEINIIVMSVRVGGRALNLTKCRYPIFYSQDFDFEINTQCQARFHRMGQTSKVTYIKLVCKDSVDEKVIEVLNNNKKLVDIVVEGKKLKELI